MQAFAAPLCGPFYEGVDTRVLRCRQAWPVRARNGSMMHDSKSHRRPGRTRLRVAALPMAGIFATGMLIATAPAAPAATPRGILTAECLSKMPLGEKAPQMYPGAWSHLENHSDISTYALR